ncbi:hypothetical protein SK128_012272 [Halocaridina rubra]|uniref:Cyclin-D1-binding protein 1 n=1 Tax=Halocaridina rubra TaxID=373956 RepID=A0AAN9A9Z5_HALRR
MAVSTSPLSNILQNTIENLLIAEQQIQEKEVHRSEADGTLEDFWKNMLMISQKLSFECTKICICFSKTPPPTAKETSGLLTAVEQAVLAMVSTFYRLSPVHGQVLRSNVKFHCVQAIQAVRQMLKIIKDEGGEAVADRYRQSTGIVWQGCEKLEKSHRDNKAMVMSLLKGQDILVSDALNEIMEAMEGDGNVWSHLGDDDDDMEEEKWSNEDKDLIGPSVNVIKAAKILYKRILVAVEKNGRCDTQEQIRELDELFEDCRHVSETTDSLILELYPPLNVSNMEEQTHHLANLLHTALKTSAQSHIVTETEKAHIEFIKGAIDHNLDKMKEKLSQH